MIFLLRFMYSYPNIFWRGLHAIFLWCIQGCVNDTEQIGVLMCCGKLSDNREIIIMSWCCSLSWSQGQWSFSRIWDDLGNFLLVYKQRGPEMFTSFVARTTLAYYLFLVCFSVVAEVWEHALMGHTGLGHKSLLLCGCFFLWCKHSSLWRSLPNPSDCHLN